MKAKQPTFFQWLIVYLTFPISVIQILRQYLQHKNDINCIKKHRLYISGKYNAANPVVVSVAKAKEVAKQNKATLNDIMLAVTTKVLKRHFIKMKDDTETITMAVPYSFRTIPQNPKDYVYDNQVVSLTLYVKLTESIKEGIAQSKKIMNEYKYSLIPMASLLMI